MRDIERLYNYLLKLSNGCRASPLKSAMHVSSEVKDQSSIITTDDTETCGPKTSSFKDRATLGPLVLKEDASLGDSLQEALPVTNLHKYIFKVTKKGKGCI